MRLSLSLSRLRPTYLGLTDASLVTGLTLETDTSGGPTIDTPVMVSGTKNTDSLLRDVGGQVNASSNNSLGVLSLLKQTRAGRPSTPAFIPPP